MLPHRLTDSCTRMELEALLCLALPTVTDATSCLSSKNVLHLRYTQSFGTIQAFFSTSLEQHQPTDWELSRGSTNFAVTCFTQSV